MGYIEGWKSLIFHTDEELKKRKDNEDISKPLFFALVIAFVLSTIYTFGSFGQMIASLGMNQAVFYFAYAAFTYAGFFLSYYLIHLVAKWLGGKGRYVAMVTLTAEFLLPLSIAMLVIFIPCIGKTIGIILGFATLYVFWIVYKFLRIRHGLSKERSIAALFGGALICAVIWLTILGAVAYQYIYLFLESGGVPPTITATQDGYHLYSPLHGGYSFDYPLGWKRLDIESNNTAVKIMIGIMQNELISTDMIINNRTNQSVSVIFYPRDSTQVIDCSTESIQMAVRSKNADMSTATASPAKINNMEGCLIKGMQLKETKARLDLFMTGNCTPTHFLVVMSDNYTTMAGIIESVRCGSEAEK